MHVGLVVNPIAGMGGRVGLKGTDGNDILLESIRRGAVSAVEERAFESLKSAGPLGEYEFLTAGGNMGEELLLRTKAKFDVVYVPENPSSANDTRIACKKVVDLGGQILLFAGGDGTARDVLDAIDEEIPVIGIPSGVKMHSGVFSINPEAAGRLLRLFVSGSLPLHRAEVMDIDEDAFRGGRLSASLYGHMLVPHEPALIQHSKSEVATITSEEEKDEIGQYVSENLEDGVLCILGPGTTVEAVSGNLGIKKTLLGVDVVLDGKAIICDATENDLMETLGKYGDAKIIVTPVGGQGFIFGRGNQPISPRVIRIVGRDNIVVIAAPSKLKEIKVLRVDTGDPYLDQELRGYMKVIVGYGRRSLVKVE